MNRLAVALCLAFVAIFAVSASRAEDIFDRLMSPGQLSKQHEKLGTNCQNCHVKFDKKGQSKLCRDCHKPINAQIVRGLGYHGRDARARNAPCSQCHAEHKGRDAALTFFDRDNFNHQFTDYPLKGGHTNVPCASCHKQGAKYAAAPNTCFACHRSDDRHKGRLGPSCASCHTDETWKKTKFDHNSTRFPLTGKHAETTCQSCHPDERYAKTPADCFSCHKLDDKHNGANGTRCESCHTTVKWATVSFDHNKQTNFPLLGRHAAVACNACHTGGGAPRKLPMTCISCHQKDDVHKGGNGPKCETCHTAAGWKKSTFDHNDTDFPLRGAHTRASCGSCHKSGVFTQRIATTCYSCHAKDDVHKGQEGQACEKCHSEVAWDSKVKFDHGLTRFPLLGLHATTHCEECHLTASYKDAPAECGACHKKDDKHKGTLGPRCGDCHNPNGWSHWQFDHDKQTKFPLTGQHAGLVCSACHKAKSDEKATASSSCIACHRSDDVHHGEYGERCELCHTTDSFSASASRNR